MRNPVGLAPMEPPSDVPPDPLLADGLSEAKNEATEAIAARGRERGFVTSEDVLDGLPDTELVPEQVEEFLAHVEQVLQDEGIEVIDVAGEDSGRGVETEGAPRRRREELLKSPTYDPVRMYIKEIGRVPLLTAMQEVDLAMRIEAGELAGELLGSLAVSGRVDQKRFRAVVDSVIRIRDHQLNPEKRLHLEGIGRETLGRSYRGGEPAKVVHLLRRVEGDACVAKRNLIEANLRLVVSIAKRYPNRGMAFLDLIQEGNLGLIRAVEKFDYTRGYKFSTYATWWIRQAITRAMADQARTIRIPVHMVEQVNRMVRARRDLSTSLGREPTVGEVAGALGVEEFQVIELISYDREPVSLDQAVGEDGESALGDFVARVDPRDEPADSVSNGMLRHEVEIVLSTLSQREQAVIRLRFGLDDGRQRTLDEVGREFGLSRERIRQIEKVTLLKLRHPSRAKRLEAYDC